MNFLLKIRTLRLSALALCVWSLQGSVAAQQHVNLERGLNAHSYLSGDFDHVNLYNGNLTLTVPLGQSYKVGGSFQYSLTLIYNSNAWYFKRENQPNHGERTRAEVNPKANAGMGWTLSLGALYPPNTPGFNDDLNGQLYVAPDGSEHLFNATLAPNRTQPGMSFTNDGTFLRLRVENGLRKIEFPDGQVHTFGSNNLLSRIEDRFGNALNVDTSNPAQWLLSERCSSCATTTRQHRITFTGGRVDEVQLDAFTKPLESPKEAVYKFFYTQASIVRHSKDNWVRDNINIDVWMLTGLQLPAGAGFYDFTYNTGFMVPSGLIRSATLPTRGHFKWDYQTYTMPAAVHDPTPVCQPYCPDMLAPYSSSDGILYKKIYNRPSDPNAIGTFDYTLGGQLATVGDPRGWTSVTVTSPEGDDTVNYFNISFDEGGYNRWDFGLPYNPKETANSLEGDLYLSQEIYKGKAENGNKLRSVYLQYNGDLKTGFPDLGNTRVTTQRTIYKEGLSADTYYKNWSGLGKFQTIQTEGTFASGNTRTTTTNYSSTMPGVGAPWILNLFDSQVTTEDSASAKVSFCFDGNTGFLKRKRVHKGTGNQLQDIFTEYVPDSDGNVAEEKYYGGDKKGNAPQLAAICDSFLATPEYQVNNTYSFGSRATSKTLGQNFFTTNNVIEQRTGLISESRDSAGVLTKFEYDELGRVTKVDSSGDADTFYTYTPAASADAQVKIERKINPSDSIPVVESTLTFDPFGRNTKQSDRMPSGALSVRETKFNALGWVTSSSDFGDTTKTTQFLDYDPFGRAAKILTPDGFETSVEYTGVSSIKRTVKIGTSRDAAGNILKTPASTYEFYDRQGRLQSVQEDSGPNNAPRVTNYQYDVGNRLKQVAINQDSGGSPVRSNVALSANGSVASASSIASANFPASSAINGDRRGQGWGQGTGGWNDGSQGDYSSDIVQVNFNGFKLLSEIDVYTLRDNFARTDPPTLTETFSTADNTGNGITHFEVQYWNGSLWLTVPGGLVTNNNKVWRQFTFPEVSASSVRVQVYGAVKFTTAGLNYSHLVEVEAWGRDAGPASVNDTVWVEDSLPTGAIPAGDFEGWNWISANPAPQSGSVSHQSNEVAGMHQHYFYGATQTMTVNAGDILVAYVYLDSAKMPSQVMLQWNENGSWEHRAYWGADQLPWGASGTASRRYMGPMPAPGQWVRLEVPASQVGLEGRVLNGMAFSLFNGRAAWDHAGKKVSGDTVWVEDSLPTGAIATGDYEGWNWISSNPAPPSGSVSHQSNVVAGMHQHYFYGVTQTQTLAVNTGDILVAYVYLDPANLPSQVMLQWNENGSWEHRAYWGADQLPWGASGTASRRYMGPMPAPGQWVRLEVPASQVGLEGRVLNGMAFSLFNGRAAWDHAGKAVSTSAITNVARQPGANVSASSQINANYPVTALVDGDRLGNNWGKGGFGSGWNDATQNEYSCDWLQVTFAESKTIDEIDVFTLNDINVEPTLSTAFSNADNSGFGITDFEVQYRQPTGVWVAIPHAGAHVTGNNKVWRQFQFPAVTTDAIRVAVHGAVKWTTQANNYSRIAEVEAYGVPAAGGGQKQVRTFNYDNRGFLFAETHPEISGTVTYSDYDTLGQPGRKVEGGKAVKYTSDATGRPIEVREEATGRILKEFGYYDANGKIKKATRHNWVRNPYSPDPNAPEIEVKVSEEYTYNGREGRMDSRITRLNEANPAHYKFNQTFQYDELGKLSSQSYPECQNSTCVQSNMATPRTVKNGYTNGYLTKVWRNSPTGDINYASAISYHVNKMVNTVQHGNGVTDTYARNTTTNMLRPHSITFTGVSVSWSTGVYEYDGAGNVVKMGSDWFLYDRANRINEGTAGTGFNGVQRKQAYTYDTMGNVLSITTTNESGPSPFNMNVDPATNRLAGLPYDASGNLLGVSASNVYQYDALNMMKKLPGKTYLYGPFDERVWLVDKGYNDLGTAPNPLPPIVETITLRGIGNEVLREYQVTSGDAVNHWQWTKDYIFRGDKLLSSESPNGRRDFHLDHLGTPRLITTSSGHSWGNPQYFYPYGAEAQVVPGEKLKFTGHERDVNSAPAHWLDYMHARYYGFNNARFINVDPGRDFDPKKPQSWNRYSYVRGNPINGTDPTGRDGENQAPAQPAPTDGSDISKDYQFWSRLIEELRMRSTISKMGASKKESKIAEEPRNPGDSLNMMDEINPEAVKAIKDWLWNPPGSETVRKIFPYQERPRTDDREFVPSRRGEYNFYTAGAAHGIRTAAQSYLQMRIFGKTVIDDLLQMMTGK